MSGTAYRLPRAVAASSITVLAPTTAASAATAARPSRRVPGRGRIAWASSSSSSWTAAASQRRHAAGSRRRPVRARRVPSTAIPGASTTAASTSPPAGGSTPAITSRHTRATQMPGMPPSRTTRRWNRIRPATTAASPSSAARLNTFEPITTPAPTLAWPRASAVTAEVISGASAASAATSPSQASENPARSASRSSRETSSQLAARLTATPATNASSHEPAVITTPPGPRPGTRTAACRCPGGQVGSADRAAELSDPVASRRPPRASPAGQPGWDVSRGPNCCSPGGRRTARRLPGRRAPPRPAAVPAQGASPVLG